MSKDTSYNCNFKTIGRVLRRVDINDLLKNADDDNNSKISACIPEFNIDLKSGEISNMQEKTSAYYSSPAQYKFVKNHVEHVILGNETSIKEIEIENNI